MITNIKGRQRGLWTAKNKRNKSNINITPFADNGKLKEAKVRCNIHWLWDYFNLPGKPGKSCRSPFREDRYPSLSVSDDGQVFYDFATDEKGDVIRFLELTVGITNKEACKKIVSFAGLDRNISPCPLPSKLVLQSPAKPNKASNEFVSHKWSFLEKGSDEDLEQLSALRDIGIEGLQLASQLNLLWFFTDGHGKRCWTVTDSVRYVRQDRTLDGSDVQLKNGCTSRARTIGKPSWPVGLANAGNQPIILLVEGSPDLLAAVHLIYYESRVNDTSAVSMLGANNAIHPIALKHFSGKRVRLFPDYDQEGVHGATVWENQLCQADVEVDIYDFGGLLKEDGLPVKDMNDFLLVDVDQWETDCEVRVAIPPPNPESEGGAA